VIPPAQLRNRLLRNYFACALPLVPFPLGCERRGLNGFRLKRRLDRIHPAPDVEGSAHPKRQPESL